MVELLDLLDLVDPRCEKLKEKESSDYSSVQKLYCWRYVMVMKGTG